MRNKDIPMETSLWRVEDAAHYLKRTPQAIYKMVERVQIPYVKIGRLVYFHPGKVEKWVLNRVVRPTSGNNS
ncbi:MAG: helix-turn-helix domain-containing protein [Planctomycetota bacterium]